MPNTPDVFYKVNDKLKLGIVLFVMVIIILLCNLSLGHSFRTLGKQMDALYEDRLVPLNYIFKMTDIFYRKQLSLETKNISHSDLKIQNDSINNMLKYYEITYLTKEESRLFTKLKSEWSVYQKMESLALDKQEIVTGNLNTRLVNMNLLLQELEKVQMYEGNKLRRSSDRIVKGTQVESQLEISILIILGVISLLLLSVREKLISNKREAEWLN